MLQQLEAYGCVPEMSDERYVVLLFSLGSTLSDAEHLLHALEHISQANENELRQGLNESSAQAAKKAVHYISTWNNLQDTSVETVSEPISFSLQSISEKDTAEVKLEHCAGYRSAEMIIPYPPGIPILYAGERISPAAVKRIQLLRDEGARFHGAADGTLRSLKIIKEGQK